VDKPEDEGAEGHQTQGKGPPAGITSQPGPPNPPFASELPSFSAVPRPLTTEEAAGAYKVLLDLRTIEAGAHNRELDLTERAHKAELEAADLRAQLRPRTAVEVASLFMITVGGAFLPLAFVPPTEWPAQAGIILGIVSAALILGSVLVQVVLKGWFGWRPKAEVSK
jgi:hypothetical protein